MNNPSKPTTLVIFGASGDLTRRKLIPALHSLFCEERLPSEFEIFGVGRSELSNTAFRQELREGVDRFGRLKPKIWDDFANNIHYLQGAYDDPESYRCLQEAIQPNALFYTAVPPSVFPTIIECLGQAGLNEHETGWRRIVIEKPFGRDQQSARQLNDCLHAVFNEDQIYRIDHYLGKETVQNILALRFANAIFEPLWNLKYIDHIQIHATEEIGIGFRGEYYDQAGVLRDIFQNHMLQLLTLTAIEPPAVWQAEALRDEKVKLLRAIRPIQTALRGQYQAGPDIKAYREEAGVDPDSHTATFAAVRLHIDNWRWRGIPFYLQSGKRLKSKSTAIVIQFKSIPHLLFSPDEREEIRPNTLALCIQPNEGIRFGIQAKEPGAEMHTRPIAIDYHYAQDFSQTDLPEAYERLLLDVIQGDASLFARADEIELAWGLIDPLVETFDQSETSELFLYPPGSWGPEQAQAFIAEQGRSWYHPCLDHTDR